MDAAVSTALCEGIYNSMASGVGGGGFITIRSANGTAEVIDARELAPGNATELMFKGALPAPVPQLIGLEPLAKRLSSCSRACLPSLCPS